MIFYTEGSLRSYFQNYRRANVGGKRVNFIVRSDSIASFLVLSFIDFNQFEATLNCRVKRTNHKRIERSCAFKCEHCMLRKKVRLGFDGRQSQRRECSKTISKLVSPFLPFDCFLLILRVGFCFASIRITFLRLKVFALIFTFTIIWSCFHAI